MKLHDNTGILEFYVFRGCICGYDSTCNRVNESVWVYMTIHASAYHLTPLHDSACQYVGY